MRRSRSCSRRDFSFVLYEVRHISCLQLDFIWSSTRDGRRIGVCHEIQTNFHGLNARLYTLPVADTLSKVAEALKFLSKERLSRPSITCQILRISEKCCYASKAHRSWSSGFNFSSNNLSLGNSADLLSMNRGPYPVLRSTSERVSHKTSDTILRGISSEVVLCRMASAHYQLLCSRHHLKT